MPFSSNHLLTHVTLSTASRTPKTQSNKTIFLLILNSDITPINHPPPGVACWHETGKAGLLPDRHVWLACCRFQDVIPVIAVL